MFKIFLSNTGRVSFFLESSPCLSKFTEIQPCYPCLTYFTTTLSNFAVQYQANPVTCGIKQDLSWIFNLFGTSRGQDLSNYLGLHLSNYLGLHAVKT
jgi:hypothetical protein